MNKYLILRFSSFGDIAQALFAAQKIREQDPSSEIHWLTRQDFQNFVRSCPAIDRVWGLDRKTGIQGLLQLVKELKREKFTHIYDAHSNIRSHLVSTLLRLTLWQTKMVRRPKNRLKRFLLFKLRRNFFPNPYRGAHSYLSPLGTWFRNVDLPDPLELQLDSTPIDIPPNFRLAEAIVLAPSATWEMKRWPTEYWSSLMQLLPQQHFVVLGGPQDSFCHEIAKSGGSRVLNLTGRLSWLQSAKILTMTKGTVSGDTGILHVADLIGQNAIAIIGPTAFGYPSRRTSLVAEVHLPCKPCTKDGRGRCRNAIYQKCLRDIPPQMVSQMINTWPK